VKVELPGRSVGGKIAVLVCKSDTNLDDFEQIDIAAHRLIVIVAAGFKAPNWARNYSRKFGILFRRSIQRKVMHMITAQPTVERW
jgi:hypothetical protein